MRLKRVVGLHTVVLVVLAFFAVFVPAQNAEALDGNKLVFAYQQVTVSQDVDVSSTIAGGSTLTATVSASEVQDWKASSDSLAVGIQLLGSGGGSIYSHSTGFITLTDGGVFNDYSISVTASGVGAGWNSVATARIFIIGQDGEFWAGNYGTQVESASLKLDGTELLTNAEFVNTSGWTSSVGWQTCSANSGYKPCIGSSNAVQINNQTTTTTTSAPATTTTTTTTTIPAAGTGTEYTEQFETPGPTTGVIVSANGSALTTSNQNGWYYANMNGGYGTSGYAIYAGNPTTSAVFTLPSNANPRSFYFRVGAKNGDATGTATYLDGTTQTFTIGNSVLTAGCSTCQAPGYYKEIYFNGNGKIITSFSLPAEGDIYFVDMLRYSDSTSVASVVDPNPAVTTTTTTTTTTVPPTTTTTVAPYYNSVGNLTGTANSDGSVLLDWDAPASSNLEPYMYDVSWFDLNNGTESGGWGVWTYAANTSYTVGSFQFPNTTGYGSVRFKIRAGNAACIGEGQGSCVYGTYETVDVIVLNPALQTTTTTSTTTTTVAPTFSGGGCGPYQRITVTGNTNSPVWGSNPYTDDSNFAAAAVHAGLISVGQTATIEPYWVSNYSFYGASTANGVTTSEWGGDWCGYYIKLVGTPTPTSTTTTTTTTTVPPTTTTTSTTTTSTTTTTTVYVTPQNTTTIAPVVETTLPPTTTVPETEDTAPETTVPEETETTVPDEAEEPSTTTTTIVEPIEEPEEDTSTTLPETTPTLPPDEETENQEEQQSTEPENQESQTESQSSQDTTVTEIVEDLTEVIGEDASAEEVADAVADVLESITDKEQAAAVVEAVLELITDNKPVDELTDEDKERIVAVVEAVISAGVDSSVASELASNAAVLESVSVEQAETVFASVEESTLTEEVAEQIVDAVQEAPAEIREAFEEVIDLFQGAFDNYTMLGQTISVGDRRTVVAVGLLTTVTATAALPSAPSPSPSPSRGSSSPIAEANQAARKNEEEEEPAGEIAGDGLEWIKHISIFKTVNGVRVVDWKAFMRKFGLGVMNLGWTLAGSLVVFLTLSGTLQTIAGVSSLMAFAFAMYLHMKEPDGE